MSGLWLSFSWRGKNPKASQNEIFVGFVSIWKEIFGSLRLCCKMQNWAFCKRQFLPNVGISQDVKYTFVGKLYCIRNKIALLQNLHSSISFFTHKNKTKMNDTQVKRSLLSLAQCIFTVTPRNIDHLRFKQ